MLMFKRLLIIFVILALTVVYSIYQKNSLESQLVSSKPATASILSKLPHAQFETLEGEPFALHEYYEKERIGLLVIHFWGTWCGPCEAELPDLLSFIRRFEDRPEVKFLLVAVNDDLNKVKKHIRGLPIPKGSVTWLLDTNNAHREKFGTTRVPETFVFSSDKMVLRKYIGPQEWNKTLFFQTFDEFLQISTHKL